MNSIKNEMLTMLEELVNIDSGTYDKIGVDKVGAYLKKHFEKLDFEITEYPNETVGNNLVVRHKDAKQPNILILAHMDTVFPEGTAAERPFSIENNYAYGPGVIDMKASHVMLYYAIKNLIDKNNDSYKNIEILLNSDEEIGTTFSRELIETQARDKDHVLVLEPARVDGSIVSSRRGVGSYTLEVIGKAAHAGIEPEKGRNAIQELSLKIPKFHALSNPEEDLHVTVGMINGGTSSNTVAAEAQATIDVRISSIEQGEYIDRKIKDLCEKSEVEGTELILTGEINRPPMIFTKEIEKMVTLIQEEAKVLGIELNHVTTGGGSDASFTASLNIPTIDGLGPIGGKQHSEEEYLEIDSLVPRMNLFSNIISKFTKNKN